MVNSFYFLQLSPKPGSPAEQSTNRQKQLFLAFERKTPLGPAFFPLTEVQLKSFGLQLPQEAKFAVMTHLIETISFPLFPMTPPLEVGVYSQHHLDQISQFGFDFMPPERSNVELAPPNVAVVSGFIKLPSSDPLKYFIELFHNFGYSKETSVWIDMCAYCQPMGVDFEILYQIIPQEAPPGSEKGPLFLQEKRQIHSDLHSNLSSPNPISPLGHLPFELKIYFVQKPDD